MTASAASNGTDSVTSACPGQNDNAGAFYGFGPFYDKLTDKRGAGKFEGASITGA